jgi:hypothetical protein
LFISERRVRSANEWRLMMQKLIGLSMVIAATLSASAVLANVPPPMASTSEAGIAYATRCGHQR